MKTLRNIFVFGALLLLISWRPDYDHLDWTEYYPVLMHKADLENSVINLQPQDFVNSGKVYIYGNNIYIVELYKGIHVIDNTTPSSPEKIGFINIPGTIDVAIKDNVLFADNAVDLVSIDISNYPTIQLLDRVNDVFPELTPPDLDFIPYGYSVYSRPPNTVIVAWVKK